MKKVLIIGAGPAGLSAGRILAQEGYSVEIFESEHCVGGMSKSFNIFEQIVDLGPHRFFSKDKHLNDFWHKHTNGEYERISRLTRIFYNHKFFYYPLRGFDALFKLGFINSGLCVLSYLRAKIAPFKGNSFESWVANAFGYRLYSIFFKSYTEKLWGIACSELDSDFAAQRIKGLNLYEAIKSAFLSGGGEKHKTLVDEFSYPSKGCGVVYENMAQAIIALGGKIHTNTQVKGIQTLNKKAKALLTNKGIVEGDIIISSAPFDEMVCSLDELEPEIKALASKLKFRNTILVYIEVEAKQAKFEDNWIYVHSPNAKTGRITNFANWSAGLRCGKNEAILCLEYWANDDEAIYKLEDKALIHIAKQDLLDSKLIASPQALKRAYVKRLHKSYPVYTSGYKEDLHKIYQALESFENCYFIGRNGSFKYNNQDHSILMGLKCAEKILGKNVDLWHINTDYDYQEGKAEDKTEGITHGSNQ